MLTPQFVVSLYYALKYRCFVSPRAEVELSPLLTFGRGSRVSAFTKINAADGPLSIGRNVAIGVGCCISPLDRGIVIGDDCMISPHVTILGGNYRYDRLDVPIHKQGMTSRGVRIGSNVWIGTGCVVLDGSEIGSGSIIAPNSVVSSRLPENSIAQGNPAKVIFTRR